MTKIMEQGSGKSDFGNFFVEGLFIAPHFPFQDFNKRAGCVEDSDRMSEACVNGAGKGKF
ncbi:hypothetical protein GCM10007874_01280 [Labrys miyagiensis]|uniref:Uncharacterized protein n=1 Tax=Labrys miyagiensis TaxID=346912 RepID=A0ABQ6C9Y9_9HYPH|nr:hypothetical protein GCM10007874_01280 [Labrys miyagiensis]